MSFRMDWQIILRANRLAGAQRLLNRLKRGLSEEISVAFRPWADQRGCWNCRFTTATWSVAFPEAVVKSIVQAQLLARNWNWGHLDTDQQTFEGQFKADASGGGTWLVGMMWASFSLVPADVPSVETGDTQDMHVPQGSSYHVSIELEECEPQTWSADDDSSLVWVTFENGVRWVATFITYKNIETLRAKSAEEGWSLGGRYLWVSSMIVIDELSRPSIEAVVEDLMRDGDFEEAFQWIGEDEIWIESDEAI